MILLLRDLKDFIRKDVERDIEKSDNKELKEALENGHDIQIFEGTVDDLKT